VHPAAVHPLLYRLGTAEAGPAELLDHSSVAEAVDRSVADAEGRLDTDPLTRLVLGLLGELDTGPDTLTSRPWLAGLALWDTDREPCRADELMLPDAVLAPLLAPDAPLGVLADELARRYPRAGAHRGSGCLTRSPCWSTSSPPRPTTSWPTRSSGGTPPRSRRPGWSPCATWTWWTTTPGRPRCACSPPNPVYRPALRAPGGYTAWWLARHVRLAGHRPRYWRLPSATGLAALFDVVPESVRASVADDGLLAAIGVRADPSVADTADAADLLARLGDPARSPDAGLTWAEYAELADAVLADRVDPAELDPPERLRAADGSVLDADRAVLLDRAWLAPALPPG